MHHPNLGSLVRTPAPHIKTLNWTSDQHQQRCKQALHPKQRNLRSGKPSRLQQEHLNQLKGKNGVCHSHATDSSLILSQVDSGINSIISTVETNHPLPLADNRWDSSIQYLLNK
ncbi:hypothetical protein PROFUN_15666 [Planoprotostelium fungivorum]|uniref:Uncharacterized protein n=1 Tax=Planoprotostelium fungivorum TaxID=1890364 RepID=A0A2P6MS61_9EUKA|nr:hypothetical protein PROFUN_15666 [Planoprotostelium fungivorum]